MKSTVKFTFDMPRDDHKYLKMASAKLGVSMKQFLLHNINKVIHDLEDEWDTKDYNKIIAEIKSGKTEMIPWEDAKKSLGL